MRRFPLLFIPACLLLLLLGISWSRPESKAEAIQIEPVVWQFNVDYPGANADDANLRVSTVYIKTHDGTDWMSVYDQTPEAVTGPDAVRRLVDAYAAKGIGVVAWFVPKGTDIEGQIQKAEQVLDSGVMGLYADLEPYDGFCNWDCGFLADNFWWRLRQERPNAHLGVIYDPRPAHWDQSATARWFAVADAALPMCYFDTFVDQGVWYDPAGCVNQAYADLNALSPGRALEYVPMLQGDTTPERFAAAVEAAKAVGASRVSIWRRGVVSPAVWAVAATQADAPPPPPCIDTLADGCLLKEENDTAIYVIWGGAKFLLPNPETFMALGFRPMSEQVVPDGRLAAIPDIPRDGALLREISSPDVYIVQGGARFYVPDVPTFFAMGFAWPSVRPIPDGALSRLHLIPADGTLLKEFGNDSVYVVYAGARFPAPNMDAIQAMALSPADVRQAPPGALHQVPAIPANGSWFAELGSGRHWLVQGGVKFSVDSSELRGALIRGHQMSDRLITVPAGALDHLPSLAGGGE